MDGDCGGGGSSYAADGGSSYYPSVPANCDNRVPYSSECQPTHHDHVYGITDPAPGQYNASDNIVYMTETQLKHQGVRPGTQVVMVTAAQAQRACQCTAGWVLFGVGFVVSVLVGMTEQQSKPAMLPSHARTCICPLVLISPGLMPCPDVCPATPFP